MSSIHSAVLYFAFVGMRGGSQRSYEQELLRCSVLAAFTFLASGDSCFVRVRTSDAMGPASGKQNSNAVLPFARSLGRTRDSQSSVAGQTVVCLDRLHFYPRLGTPANSRLRSAATAARSRFCSDRVTAQS